jgi:PiT family inorganic phosphate transporter
LAEELTLVAVVVVALFFDFTNGFHDTANAIATSVSTRAVSRAWPSSARRS